VPVSAAGASPTIVRDDVDETFVDEVLGEECGVGATVHLQRASRWQSRLPTGGGRR
jgi:hypothetical protein